MLEDTDTLAEQSLVAELLAAIRTARLDASPLATTQAAATELGLADTSSEVVALWWSGERNLNSPWTPKIFVQHGKFRLSDSFVVHRFPMPRIPTTLKAWQASSVSILTEAEAESVVAIERKDLRPKNGELIWRVEREPSQAWRETSKEATAVSQARVASCLFYAQALPVHHLSDEVNSPFFGSRGSPFGEVNDWDGLTFTLRNGERVWVRLNPRTGTISLPRLGKGSYSVGRIQLNELAPSREALLGDAPAIDPANPIVKPSGNAAPPGDVKHDWQGIAPADYLFIVFPTMHRPFPGLMPTTQSDAEAHKDAVEFIRLLSMRGMPFDQQMNQQAKNPTTHAGPDGNAPTLADHPNGIPPAEVIAAAKLLEPNKHSPEPIVAEDGIYVLLQVK